MKLVLFENVIKIVIYENRKLGKGLLGKMSEGSLKLKRSLENSIKFC